MNQDPVRGILLLKLSQSTSYLHTSLLSLSRRREKKKRVRMANVLREMCIPSRRLLKVCLSSPPPGDILYRKQTTSFQSVCQSEGGHLARLSFAKANQCPQRIGAALKRNGWYLMYFTRPVCVTVLFPLHMKAGHGDHHLLIFPLTVTVFDQTMRRY